MGNVPFVPVAEEVSLTGGSAVQRIRLIDEDEQVIPEMPILHFAFYVLFYVFVWV